MNDFERYRIKREVEQREQDQERQQKRHIEKAEAIRSTQEANPAA
jgi:hypothetical protein